mgnify:CR=1 FL=1
MTGPFSPSATSAEPAEPAEPAGPSSACAGVARSAARLIRRWPADRPLLALVDGSADNDPSPRGWGRTLLATTTPPVPPQAPPVASARGPFASRPPSAREAADPLDPLTRAVEGGSLGLGAAILRYDLGEALEPAARARFDRLAAPVVDARPLGAAVELSHDRARTLGDPSELRELAALSDADADADADGRPGLGFALGPLRSTFGRRAYTDAVARAVGLVHAGDVFQVNLSHVLEAPFEGSPRALAAAVLGELRPPFGAYFEHAAPVDIGVGGSGGGSGGGGGGGRGGLAGATLSISPELFLTLDPGTRRVETRPIKGTRPLARAAELDASEKDAAELAMIVDLMRNDLGRVASVGSVRVERARSIERHADAAGVRGVAHAVATVSARLADGRDLRELLRAAFPAGSITGAPKIRAMQIIAELEPERRGDYCGSVALLQRTPVGLAAVLSVGIRTATLVFEPGSTAEHARGVLRFPVGAGIVADSDPGSEWLETLHKADSFAAAAGTTVRDEP